MNIANKLTILRIILIPVFIVFFYIDVVYWNYWAALVFIVAAVTDLLDGMLARKRDIVTDFGKLIDPIADKLLVCSALILILSRPEFGLSAIAVIILIGREFFISGFRMLAAAKGKVVAAGSLGKIKTVVQIVAISAVLMKDTLWFLRFAEWGIPLGAILIWASVALALWSLVDYFVRNREVLKDLF